MGDKFIFEKAEEILFIQVCGLWKTKTMAKLELLLIFSLCFEYQLGGFGCVGLASSLEHETKGLAVLHKDITLL